MTSLNIDEIDRIKSDPPTLPRKYRCSDVHVL